mmetsp:Transcript_14551/g.21715  ORF Transcript_14551/g.21715 Transcript_14551/m.21715 type:complete len:283 (+) Transcript_14551:588-1436(+)
MSYISKAMTNLNLSDRNDLNNLKRSHDFVVALESLLKAIAELKPHDERVFPPSVQPLMQKVGQITKSEHAAGNIPSALVKLVASQLPNFAPSTIRKYLRKKSNTPRANVPKKNRTMSKKNRTTVAITSSLLKPTKPLKTTTTTTTDTKTMDDDDEVKIISDGSTLESQLSAKSLPELNASKKQKMKHLKRCIDNFVTAKGTLEEPPTKLSVSDQHKMLLFELRETQVHIARKSAQKRNAAIAELYNTIAQLWPKGWMKKRKLTNWASAGRRLYLKQSKKLII